MLKLIQAIRITVGVVFALSTISCSDYYDLAELKAGNDRSIFMMAESSYENDQAVYYRVEVKGRAIVPRNYISSIDPDRLKGIRFQLVSNKSGSVFGVVSEQLPQKIWALHNFATGETYPGCPSGSGEQCERQGKALLEELQKDHPEITFIL